MQNRHGEIRYALLSKTKENLMLAVLFGLFAALCWSLHDLLARKFASDVGPCRMAIGTLLAGATLLTGIVFWNGTILNADPKTLQLALILGIIYGLAVSSLFIAFSLAPVSVVGPATAGYPALVVVRWHTSHPGFWDRIRAVILNVRASNPLE